MRNVLIGILLAGAASSPAFAQDPGDHRWHHDQQQGGRGEGHQQRQERAPQAQAQQPQAPMQAQQQGRGPRGDGGNFIRQQQGQVQQGQVQQGRQGPWGRGRFEGRPNVAPEGQVQQQAYGYRGPMQGQRNRGGGWTRTEGYRAGENEQQRVGNAGWYGQRGVAQQQYRNGGRYAAGTWNRDWRSDRRYDWRDYRDRHRSAFRLGLYIDPFGYGYQPFSIGYRLSPVYFGQQYWIDPALYELPYPPPGTQWVRYWNDAVLVDMYSGSVVDVIQGFFW